MNDYLVFARTEYSEPVEHQGYIQAADAEQAKKLAVERFGEQWLELLLVPEPDVHWVMRKEEAEVETSA
jgi:1,2-phenylacetyl-CoA epoxidase PaaB subunit